MLIRFNRRTLTGRVLLSLLQASGLYNIEYSKQSYTISSDFLNFITALKIAISITIRFVKYASGKKKRASCRRYNLCDRDSLNRISVP